MGKWSPPRRNGTDQGKQFDRMNPTEKAAEFDASDVDPRAYAERNFAGGQPTRDAQYQAAREEQQRQAEETRKQGRHRK